jgi:hypothetical protein
MFAHERFVMLQRRLEPRRVYQRTDVAEHDRGVPREPAERP